MKCASVLMCLLIVAVLIIYLFPIVGENFDSHITTSTYDPETQSIQSGHLFIPQPIYISAQGEYISATKDSEMKDATEAGVMIPGNYGIDSDICSKSCCNNQWPLPFKIPIEESVCNSKQDFFPSNITCNNSYDDAGCLCMTKKQKDILENRGQ